MTRRPTVSQALAMQAAAAAAVDTDEVDEVAAVQKTEAKPSATRTRGRPKGRRPVEAKLTVYLDARRHAALVHMAEDRGRSIHSLILEGVDQVIGKPVTSGWK